MVQMNKISFILLFCMVVLSVMCFACIGVLAAESGTVGENISWNLSDDGTLTLSGTGEVVFEKIYTYIQPVIPWNESKADIKKVIIGEGITNIDEYSFERCYALEEVSIPDSVTVIETNAFAGCENLKKIKIGKNVETLGSFAFSGCYALEEIEWGEKLKTIDVYAFSHCALRSVEIPATVTDFADSVFQSCRNLAEIIIPDSVKEVRKYAVYDTAYYNNQSNWENGVLYIGKHLVYCEPYDSEGVVTVKPGTLTIAGGAFENSRKITEIVIPDSVRYIGDGAFSNGTMLEKCIIPDSVTEIGEGIFSGCKAIKEYRLPSGLNVIPKYTFQNSGITSYTIPSNIKRVETYAFRGCESLKDITISEGVEYIGDGAFSDCTAIEEVVIPDSVTSVGNWFFFDCTSLKKITIGDGLCDFYSSCFSGCDAVETLIIGDAVDNDNLSYVLYELKNLKHLTIGDGITRMNTIDSTLKCKNLIETLVLGDGITEIGAFEFEDYTSLKSITLGKNIKIIDSLAFDNTAFYKNTDNWENGCLYIGTYLIKVDGASNEIETLTIKEGTTLIAADAGHLATKIKSVIFPQSLKYIGNEAFDGCSNIKEIELPSGIVDIGYKAFSNTGYYKDATKWTDNLLYIGTYLIDSKSGIETVTVKEGTTCIGEKCFQAPRTTIKKIVLPDSVLYISGNAFFNCTALEEINIGKVKNIGEYAFYGTAIKSVKFSDEIEEIGDSAFSRCQSLEFAEINSGTIGQSAFGSCSNLKDLRINEGVTYIGGSAFYGCTSLKKVKIPASVTMIDSSVFGGCTALEKAYIKADVLKLNNTFGSGCNALAVITVPKTVKTLESFFYYDTPLKHIYYEGTREQWEEIENSENVNTGITIHYGEEAPAEVWIKKVIKEEGKPVKISIDIDNVQTGGKLVGISQNSDLSTSFASGEITDSAELTFDEVGSEVKIIWWESLESMKPVINPVTAVISQ